MAGKESDRFADALRAMSSGEEETEHADASAEEIEPVDEPVPVPPPVPAPPAARPSRPASPVPSSPAPARPSQSSSRPARPTAPAIAATAPTPTPAPAAPPVAVPAAKRPARPTAPAAVPPPIPAPSAAAPTSAPVSYARKPVARAKRKSKTGSIEFRRTLIPSCLVVGSMFVLLTILFFFQPADAALRQARVFVPIAIGVLGVVLLAVGVFNMLLVKKELERKQSQSAE